MALQAPGCCNGMLCPCARAWRCTHTNQDQLPSRARSCSPLQVQWMLLHHCYATMRNIAHRLALTIPLGTSS